MTMLKKSAKALAALAIAMAWGAGDASVASALTLDTTTTTFVRFGGAETDNFFATTANVLMYQSGATWMAAGLPSYALFKDGTADDPEHNGTGTGSVTVADDATNFHWIGLLHDTGIAPLLNPDGSNVVNQFGQFVFGPGNAPLDENSTLIFSPFDALSADDEVAIYENLRQALVAYQLGTGTLADVVDSFEIYIDDFDGGDVADNSISINVEYGPFYFAGPGQDRSGTVLLEPRDTGTVPEPTTFALMGAGAAALAFGRSGRRS